MATSSLAAVFAGAMDRLGPFERAPRIAVAVSGGADSLALLLLAADWAQARGGSVLALTVDHCLRPEAAAEARQVAAWAAARRIDHRVLTLPTPPNGSGGAQAAARAARYQALAAACGEAEILHLLLGHHRDDQAETLLLRLHRGSGPSGLSGMAPGHYQADLRLLRPLLGVRKAALLAECRAAGLVPLDDPSNAKTDFTRVRLRQAMAAAPDLFPPVRLAETADRMAVVRAAADRAADRWLTRAVTVLPPGLIHFPIAALTGADPETLRAALGRLAAFAGGSLYPPRGEALAGLAARLREGEVLTLGGLLWFPRRGTVWVGREAAAQAPARDLPPGRVSPRWDGRFRAIAPSAGWQIAALGAERGARLRRTPGFRRPETRLAADLARAPAAILAGIAVFQRLDGPALVPHLSEMPGDAPRLLAAPRRPLTAEGERGS